MSSSSSKNGEPIGTRSRRASSAPSRASIVGPEGVNAEPGAAHTAPSTSINDNDVVELERPRNASRDSNADQGVDVQAYSTPSHVPSTPQASPPLTHQPRGRTHQLQQRPPLPGRALSPLGTTTLGGDIAHGGVLQRERSERTLATETSTERGEVDEGRRPANVTEPVREALAGGGTAPAPPIPTPRAPAPSHEEQLSSRTEMAIIMGMLAKMEELQQRANEVLQALTSTSSA
jgi:hypothetical protein